MKIKILITLFIISGLGTGCTVYGMPKPPVTPTLPTSWLTASAGAQNGAKTTPNGRWWSGFDDPALNRLMERALEKAPDRKLALARIREASANARASLSRLGPLATSTAQGARNRNNPQNVNNFSNAGFDATWEIDLFGRNTQTANAARATRDATIADERAVTLSLLGEVARHYVLYRQFTLLADNARRAVTAHDGIVSMTRTRMAQGLDSQLEVARAQNARDAAAAQIPFLENLALTSALQIDLLLGDAPGRNKTLLHGGKNAIPHMNTAIIADTPARVIAMRPDIDAAMNRVVAAAALEKATFAAALPRVNLATFLGWSAGDRLYQLNGAITTPLFQFGRIRAEIKAADARTEQTVIAFERAVLDALRDIETAQDTAARMALRMTDLDNAAQQAVGAQTLVAAQQQQGMVSGLEVQQAALAALAAHDAAIRGQSDHTLAVVALCKSLALQPDTP